MIICILDISQLSLLRNDDQVKFCQVYLTLIVSLGNEKRLGRLDWKVGDGNDVVARDAFKRLFCGDHFDYYECRDDWSSRTSYHVGFWAFTSTLVLQYSKFIGILSIIAIL